VIKHLAFRSAGGLHKQRGTDVFYIYVLFLILSGIAMLVLASVKTGQTPTRRAWNAVFGAGFTVYGLYLLLFFHGGHYVIFFYVFLLPILMIVRFVRDRSAVRRPRPGYGQPSSYGQSSGGQLQDPVQ
jgi:hypothetical protein